MDDNSTWILLQIVPQLQRVLTTTVYRKNLAQLLSQKDGVGGVRLESLSSPHALTWVDEPGFSKPLARDEFKCALKWSLGIPLRSESYVCEECGGEGDNMGLHTVSCLRSGEIGRGHSALKAAMEMLLNKAGCNVRIEEPILSNDGSKFMDILATGLYPTPTAIDVTVINTVRASAFNASNNSVLNGLLDEAAEVKNRKYKELCAVKGWTFVPAVCDAFGAMRSNTRMLVKKIIKKVETKVEAEERPLIGRKVWGTLTTAIVSRAAKQLAQVEHKLTLIIRHASP